MLRAGDTLVVRWVDRLGRNYADVTDTIREFIRRGIVVRTVINGLTFDGATKDPMQQAVRDSLIAFMAATAQAQAKVIKEAQKAGIAHAQAHDDGTKYRGRKPTFTREQFALVRELLKALSPRRAAMARQSCSRSSPTSRMIDSSGGSVQPRRPYSPICGGQGRDRGYREAYPCLAPLE
jgi:DNA invertase Pin-like site-specific DNA recombinase